MLIADAHVHIHDCFDLARFLGAAFSNFRHAALQIDCDRTYVPVLCLAEGRGQRVFQRLSGDTEKGKDGIGQGNGEIFRLYPTGEPESLRIENAERQSLFLVSGRQIVTSERLEVLALSTVSEIRDGLPLEKTVGVVEKEGALPVVPWGFGKWSGKRGDILREYLAARNEGVFFLGDNGGRPKVLRFPDFQRKDAGGSIKVLPGSDALPFPSELEKVGRFGFALRGEIDARRPGEGLKRNLLRPGAAPIPYGSPERISRFAWNQTILRIWKRRI
jgi:hypothetical protein